VQQAFRHQKRQTPLLVLLGFQSKANLNIQQMAGNQQTNSTTTQRNLRAMI
jgi:hypothetical protein